VSSFYVLILIYLCTKDITFFPNTFYYNKLSRPVYSSYLFDDDDDDDRSNLMNFHNAVLSVVCISLRDCILLKTLKTISVPPTLLSYAMHLNLTSILPTIIN